MLLAVLFLPLANLKKQMLRLAWRQELAWLSSVSSLGVGEKTGVWGPCWGKKPKNPPKRRKRNCELRELPTLFLSPFFFILLWHHSLRSVWCWAGPDINKCLNVCWVSAMNNQVCQSPSSLSEGTSPSGHTWKLLPHLCLLAHLRGRSLTSGFFSPSLPCQLSWLWAIASLSLPSLFSSQWGHFLVLYSENPNHPRR